MPISKEFAEAFFGPQVRFQEGVQDRLDKYHKENRLLLKELRTQVLSFAARLDSRKLSLELTDLVYEVMGLRLEELEAIHGEDR